MVPGGCHRPWDDGTLTMGRMRPPRYAGGGERGEARPRTVEPMLETERPDCPEGERACRGGAAYGGGGSRRLSAEPEARGCARSSLAGSLRQLGRRNGRGIEAEA